MLVPRSACERRRCSGWIQISMETGRFSGPPLRGSHLYHSHHNWFEIESFVHAIVSVFLRIPSHSSTFGGLLQDHGQPEAKYPSWHTYTAARTSSVPHMATAIGWNASLPSLTQLSRCFESPISHSSKFGGLLQDQSARGEIPKLGTYTVSRPIPCFNMPHSQRRNIQIKTKAWVFFMNS